VINKVKGEYTESGEKINPTGDEKKEEQKEDEKKTDEIPTESPPSSTDYGQLFKTSLWKSRDLASSFVVGVKETWKELIEGPKESKIKKTVAHAEVVRTKKASTGDEDDEEEEAKAAPYTGPTAVVVSKTKRSTWEDMAARLENSPLIREMLKNSRKIGRQAAATDIGQQAQKIGEQVTNKIHVSPPLPYSACMSVSSHSDKRMLVSSGRQLRTLWCIRSLVFGRASLRPQKKVWQLGRSKNWILTSERFDPSPPLPAS
jgi:hypothetical protein